MEKFITPRKLQGFWELMPNDQIHFSRLLNAIENVFKSNCFVQLDSPVLEYSETLLAKSGGETDKEVYRFSKGNTDMCMRYDLTVPLARFVAMHKNELNFPFKRYQIGKVYRGERPQKGRFREFYQCDADIIGNGKLSIIADAECVNMLRQCFDALNVDVVVKVSNRKILSGFIEKLNKTEKINDILVVLDKIHKLNSDQILTQLNNIGLDNNESENLINLTKTQGKWAEIEKISNFCDNEIFKKGIRELRELEESLSIFGTKNVVYDLSIIRGHNYYTGTVFEAFLNGSDIAVGGGGRFENLCSYFSNDVMQGVGMSVGVTRLFDILQSKNYFNQNESEIDCAVIYFEETLNDSLRVMCTLRENGVRADCFYENKSFKSQMKEANRRNVKYVLIVGENELKSGVFALKNMTNGKQEELTLSQIAQKIKRG